MVLDNFQPAVLISIPFRAGEGEEFLLKWGPRSKAQLGSDCRAWPRGHVELGAK